MARRPGLMVECFLKSERFKVKGDMQMAAFWARVHNYLYRTANYN